MEFGDSNERQCIRLASSKVRELLKCSVCLDFMNSSIYQCRNGHPLCSRCKRVVKVCPNCREEIGHIRCLALEKMADLLQPHCKYEESGRPESLSRTPPSSRNFRPYNCPWSEWGCSVTGDISRLISHLTYYHLEKIINLPEFDFRFLITNIGEDQKGPWMVFKCYGEYFCLQGVAYSTRSPPVYMTFLRFVGNPADVGNYGYKLEIEWDRMKFTFEGTPISVKQGSVENDEALIWMKKMKPCFGGRTMSQELEVRAGRIWKKSAV